jgi:hypothetical protein
MPPRCELIDAFERNLAHPNTFAFPGFGIVARVTPGDLLKVGVEFDAKEAASSGERFWVIVTQVDRNDGQSFFRGTVDNDLLHTAFHGLSLGDAITFEARHILDFIFEHESS